jgi:hypothetical protein
MKAALRPSLNVTALARWPNAGKPSLTATAKT